MILQGLGPLITAFLYSAYLSTDHLILLLAEKLFKLFAHSLIRIFTSSFCLCLYVSVCLSVCLCVSVYVSMSMSLSVSVSVCFFLCLSVCLPLSLPSSDCLFRQVLVRPSSFRLTIVIGTRIASSATSAVRLWSAVASS